MNFPTECDQNDDSTFNQINKLQNLIRLLLNTDDFYLIYFMK